MAKKATAAATSTGGRSKAPIGTQPRKSAVQVKVDEISKRLNGEGYVVVESNGKYNIKKGTRARKFLTENLTVAGLENYANNLLGGFTEEKLEETNAAIASEVVEDKSLNVVEVLENAGDEVVESTETVKAAVSPDELPPSQRPNTDPTAAILMHTALHVPREYDFIGTATKPSTEVSAALIPLESLQVKGELRVAILLDVLQRPSDTKRLELAMFLAQNGIETRFLDGDRVELSTLALPVSTSNTMPEFQVKDEGDESEIDLSQFM